MATPTLQTLGPRLRAKRAERGIRAVATEIGISPATLSRVERGFLPDLETFGKICKWLEIDPGEILRIKSPIPEKSPPAVAVHFRKNQTISAETAGALAKMILAAQRALLATNPASE